MCVFVCGVCLCVCVCEREREVEAHTELHGNSQRFDKVQCLCGIQEMSAPEFSFIFVSMFMSAPISVFISVSVAELVSVSISVFV